MNAFVVYTYIYLVLLYLGPTIGIVLPFCGVLVILLRELYLILAILYFFYTLTIRKKILCTRENNYLSLCCFLALPFIFQAGIVRGISIYLLFYSGPILFLIISNLKFSKAAIRNYNYFLSILLDSICLIGIVIYFFQNKIVNLFGYENFKQFFYQNGSGKMRLMGLGFHPTTTGFLVFYAMGRVFFRKKQYVRSIFYFIIGWLTNTRSALFGIPSYIFVKTKKQRQILLVIPMFIGLFVIYKMFINKTIYKFLDASSFVHLLHLFVEGPQAAIKYPFGIGLGTVSPYSPPPFVLHLESDFYLYSIQVGIINLVIYILSIITIVNKLKKDSSREAKYLLFILLTFMLGCIIFPLHTLRFTSNFIFIELGFFFSRKIEE